MKTRKSMLHVIISFFLTANIYATTLETIIKIEGRSAEELYDLLIEIGLKPLANGSLKARSVTAISTINLYSTSNDDNINHLAFMLDAHNFNQKIYARDKLADEFFHILTNNEAPINQVNFIKRQINIEELNCNRVARKIIRCNLKIRTIN